MEIISSLYPKSPDTVSQGITEPSAAFKKEVTKVLGSIILFLVVYFIMILLSVLLAIACVYAGASLIISLPRMITILLGLGIMGLGVMVIIFLLKFLFMVNKHDSSGNIEITEAEQPTLFAFIRQITKETHTEFPKKVFISPEVNAGVFYNSSFWSMFLPVKKNLEIGLGLVNSLTISEFKAVVAHEFGHFSQRSMKLGSYVYNVNRVIYNLLYENKSYGGLIESWAGISGYFAIFARITVSIVTGIQKVLQWMYGFINRNYMSLSRQMEFHADTIAAASSGSQNLITALQRLEVAQACYSAVIDKCNQQLEKKAYSQNFYPHQSFLLRYYARVNELEMINDLPLVTREFIDRSRRSRINFKDQWASHPSTEDRIEHLNKLAIDAEVMNRSSWELFVHPEQLQQAMTEKIYQSVELPVDKQQISAEDFESFFEEHQEQYSFPAIFNGFYDGRKISEMNIEELATSVDANGQADKLFKEVLTEVVTSLPKSIEINNNDLEILHNIQSRQLQVRTFDFNGVKYTSADADKVIAELEADNASFAEQLKSADENIFRFFYAKALLKDKTLATSLKDQYKKMQTLQKKADDYWLVMGEVLSNLRPVFAGETIQIEDANTMVRKHLQEHEPKLKDQLMTMLSEDIFANKKDEKLKVELFLEKDYVYFQGNGFHDNELSDLYNVLSIAAKAWTDHMFISFKGLLQQQADLIS